MKFCIYKMQNLCSIFELTDKFLQVYLDTAEPLVIMCAGNCEKEALFLQELVSIQFVPKHIYFVDILYEIPRFLETATNNIKNILAEGTYTFLTFITELKVPCNYLIAINFQLMQYANSYSPSFREQNECLDKIPNKIIVIMC